MKITIEITSETRNEELSKIVKALDAMIYKPEENAGNQKTETKKAQKVEKIDADAKETPIAADSKEPEPKSERVEIQTEAPSVDTIEDSADRATETPQIDYDSLKKKVLDAKANGLDFEGAIERGTNGLSRKLIPIKSETHLFGAIYAELEKLFRDAEGA